MSFTYQYTATVNAGRLNQTVSDSSISIKLDGIAVNGTQVELTFAAELSAEEKTVLDGIMVTDQTTPLEKVDRERVEVLPPKGNSMTLPSHNLCDRTTWYQGSVKVTGETPVQYRVGHYGLSHKFIIDVFTGKLAFENRLQTYAFKLYDGGTELVFGEQYLVNWEMGIVVLQNYNPSGTITCDYHYADSSIFKIAPPGDKKLYVSHAEVQFSKDIRMKPIKIDFLAGGHVIHSDTYKNLDNLIDVCRQGKGEIPAVDTLRTGRIVFPITYDPALELDPAINMEVAVYLDNDKPMEGERATITFYTKEFY